MVRSPGKSATAGPTAPRSASSKPQASEAQASEPKKAHGVDAEIKSSNLKRLRRIEGQVRGLHRMVEEDRYCPDILMQVASVQEALKSVSRELVRNHLSHCARQALQGSDEQAQVAVDELIAVWSKHNG